MEACAYRRPGFDRDRVPTALRLSLEIKGLFSSAGNQALVSRNQEMESINSSGKIRPAATPCRPPTDTSCPRAAARAPFSVVCPHIFGRNRPARVEKPFAFNAAAARDTPKCAY